MVQNALWNGAKYIMEGINIRFNGIYKTLSRHEIHGKKGKMGIKKCGFRG